MHTKYTHGARVEVAAYNAPGNTGNLVYVNTYLLSQFVEICVTRVEVLGKPDRLDQ
jgi:hypothetical protein